MEDLHSVNAGGPEVTVIRIPAAECWVLSDTVVLKPKQAATWTREQATSPTGAFKGIIDPESGGYV